MASSSEPAGSVRVEFVADLSKLDAGYAAANARMQTAGPQMVSSLDKVEVKAKSVGKAIDGVGEAGERAAQGTARVATASERAAASWQRMAAQAETYTKAARAAADAQAMVNAAVGVRSGFGGADRAADIAAYGAEMDRLRAKFSPLFAAEQQHKALLSEINAAARVGAISETERADAVARAGMAYTKHTAGLRAAGAANDNFGKATEIARHHLVNLGAQISDVGVSLVSGQSPFMVMVQQGSQIAPILGETGVMGAVKGVAGAIRGFLTPAVLGVGALTAAAVLGYGAWSRYDEQTRATRTTLDGLGRQVGLTVAQFEQLTRVAAAAGGLTEREASSLGRAYAATGRLGPENIAKLLTLSKDAATTFGVSLDDVAAKLGTSFSNVAGIERLNQQITYLDDKKLSKIKDLFDKNDVQGGISVAIDALRERLAKYENSQSAISRGWEAIKDAAVAADVAVGKAIDRIVNGPSLAQKMADLKARVEYERQAAGEQLVQPGSVSRTYVPPTAPTVASTAPLPPSRPQDLQSAEEQLRRYMETLAETKRQEEETAKNKSLEDGLMKRSNEIKNYIRETGAGSDEARKWTKIDEDFQTVIKSGNPKLMERLDNLKDFSEAASIAAQASSSLKNADGSLMTQAERAARQNAVEVEDVRANTLERRAKVAAMRQEEAQRGQLITREQAAAQIEHAASMVRERADEQLRERLRDQAREADDLQERIRLVGADAEARAVANAKRQAENEIIREGGSLQSDLARQVVAGAEANARLGVSYDRTREAQQRLQDGARELGTEFTTFIEATLLGTTKMSDAFKQLSQSLSGNVLKALLTGEGPLAGILGTAPTERGQTGGLLGGRIDLGSLFPARDLREAVFGGTSSGITEALGPLLEPRRNATGQSMGFFSSPLGGGLAAAGAGGAIGYSSANPVVGALGGGLAGFNTTNDLQEAA